MSVYNLGQTVYYVEFIANIPSVVEFLIVAIRETELGYMYSKYIDTASPYMPESQLFETAEDAINYQIAVLEALIPTP